MGAKRKRPEQQGPAEVYYNDAMARNYTESSRNNKIQETLAERALEMLALPRDGIPKFLLDIGCGTGLSGQVLSKHGHHWLGIDIAASMLDVALEDLEVNGDLLCADIGHGLGGLRPGVVDGAISISTVQWLCNSDKSCDNPYRRLRNFFDSLYKCLARGGKAVLQIYPDSHEQAELILTKAMLSGFSGCVVVDYPHSKKSRKFFLFLVSGTLEGIVEGKKGQCESDEVCLSKRVKQDDLLPPKQEVAFAGRLKQRKKSASLSRRNYVLQKKERQRAAGKCVRRDTKYTGRKRKSRMF